MCKLRIYIVYKYKGPRTGNTAGKKNNIAGVIFHGFVDYNFAVKTIVIKTM